MQIKIKGLASGKSYIFNVDKSHIELNLLEFLQKNDMPVASSCSGQTICKKCVTADHKLSCEIMMKDLKDNEEFAFTYL